MRLKAHAKINLTLRIFEPRPDGFHSIESVMQSVSLCDYITLIPIASGIEVSCSDPNIPLGQDNLVYKAAELLGGKVKIHIEKHIPMAAGLAGGSADAAAVMYGLNSELRMPNAELMKIGAKIGSDIPFCLTGGTCLVTGRGEIVEKQEPWPKTYFVLVCPNVLVSSKWAYEEFDSRHLEISPATKNDLEPIVISRHEIISKIKAKLLSLGCSEAQMSGSGPSVFGAVQHQVDAKKIYDKIIEVYPRSFLIETVDKGIEISNED